MMMKSKVSTLRDKIVKNKEYLSNEYQSTSDILYELNRMIHWNMSHSMMFQWWCNNEDSINIINELLQKLEE